MSPNDPRFDDKIAVIADDLTGANDAGVQFAKQGLPTLVLIGPDPPAELGAARAVVMDTDSRAVLPEEAYRRAAGAAAWFRERGFEVFFKKVDSTLRGPIGAEIDAILDTCGQGLAVVVPAFPATGRISVGGYHLLHGVPIEATEIARDLRAPVAESHLPTLLSGQSTRRVGHLGIKSLLAGPSGILSALRKEAAGGRQVIVCDAWLAEHLKMIAGAAQQIEERVLWVGSAGLAEVLPGALGLDAPSPPGGIAGRRSGKGGAVAVFAGSVSRVTRGQVEALSRRSEVEHLELDPSALLCVETFDREIESRAEAALEAIRAGKDLVITSGYDPRKVTQALELAALRQIPAHQTAAAIADAMGRFCGKLVAGGAALGGLVLTGGDTALSCCRRLAATGLFILQEVAPGIPLGRLQGGQCDGLHVVTKAGAFGAEDALCRAVDCLKKGHRA